MKILHVITGMGSGGAEAMLLKLLRATSTAVSQEVVSLVSGGELSGHFASLGIPIFSMDMRRNALPVLALGALTRLIESRRPDIVQTWMYHADLLGGIAARRAKIPRVIWGIRNSTLGDGTSLKTRLTVTACALLSKRLPDKIVSCSHTAARVHKDLGYAGDRFIVIPNGFDTERFQPSVQLRRDLRITMGLPPETRLIGFVARNDPQKDFPTFCAAAAEVLAQTSNIHLLVVGRGYEHVHGETSRAVDSVDPTRLHFLGHRDDIDRIMPAIDVLALSSAYGEAFPNVLGEAMACGVPCVATNVGDSENILGGTGIVVAPRSPKPLAEGLLSILAMPPDTYGDRSYAARDRIMKHYSLPAIADTYASLWNSLTGCVGDVGPGSSISGK
jgi:glycosyltransferase involved in cell wall biosynthesis